MVRLKENRNICLCETGEIRKVKDITAGRYEIYVKKSGGFKKGETDTNGFETKNKYILIKKEYLKGKKPILLLASTNLEKFSDEELIEKYLGRWGVETQFRKVKQLYKLESLQIRNWKRRKNLLAVLLFTHFLNGRIEKKLESAKKEAKTWALATWMFLKKFLKKKSKNYNSYSFTEFLRTQIPETLSFHLRVKSHNKHSRTTQIGFFE